MCKGLYVIWVILTAGSIYPNWQHIMNWQHFNVLMAECPNGILLKGLLFYFMEYRMIIGFYHIHKYMTFDMDMF